MYTMMLSFESLLHNCNNEDSKFYVLNTTSSEYTFFHSTVVDCGTLNITTNGHVIDTAGTTFRQTATYSCNTGYNLVGDSIRTCQADGMWSGSEPTCQGVLL